ncbi:aldehyde dehydrogenase, partial [Candidatus Bipolaricaulota bacterium]|nr:aldehyde dehydrogenase [Candidatus Bipolaricaulota bacterium]
TRKEVLFMKTYKLFLGGDWKEGREKQGVINPFNGDLVAETHIASAEDVSRAVDSASKSQKGWQDLDQPQKAEYLRRIAEGIGDRDEELARLETRECGRPLHETRSDIEAVAATLHYYAGLADKIEGRTIPVEGKRFSFTLREPLGVTAHITPWNFPLKLAIRSLAPSLIAGNTVVLKPPIESPLTCLEFARETMKAGLPSGVVNVIPGPGSKTGEALVSHENIDGIGFIGSLEVGKKIAEEAGNKMIPSVMELGGKSPQIVFPDADIPKTAEGVIGGIFRASGQSCNAGSRLFVHKDIYREFLEELTRRTEKMVLGNGLNDETDMGPLINEQQLDSVKNLVDRGIENGAEVLAGGKIARGDTLNKGCFYRPTLLTNVEKGSKLDQEEIFGPVLVIHQFSSKEEVIEEANNVKYGLYGGIWTNDLSLAHEVARRIKAGGISVNEYPSVFPQLPFGGVKKSGVGREQGMEAIENFLQTKSVTIKLEE